MNYDTGRFAAATQQLSLHQVYRTMNTRLKRILLIDDDESVLDSLQSILADSGYEILIARDGAEGLMKFERDTPDLIVLDVVMPRRSGFVVLERLQRHPFLRPKIIMVSGNHDERHRDFALAHGASAFFCKPFDIDEVVAKIYELLDENRGEE